MQRHLPIPSGNPLPILVVVFSWLALAAATMALELSLSPKSIGGDGVFTTESSQGRPVWVPESGDYLYFDVPGSFVFTPGAPVYVRIEYLDEGRGRINLQYDSSTVPYKGAEVHSRSSRVGSGAFVQSHHMFEFSNLAGRQNGGTDFRLRAGNSDGTPLRVASVAISTTPYDDPNFQLGLSRPWLQPYSGPVKDFTSPKTLVGKVMTGYQGWFAAPNDPDDEGWNHWGRSSNVDPSPTEITIDAWPWLDEYDFEKVYPAGNMVFENGRPAYLFSSRDLETVQRHFRWMRKYNIDGAYLQRFVTQNSGGSNGKPEFVLNNVREAANREGRVWAIEYDVSSLDGAADPLAVMQQDWNWLVNEAHILDDPRYVHEDGKPVLFIWGFSVNGRDFTVAQADAILDWFVTQGVYLIGGVNATWESNTAWYNHYQKYDQLLGWMETSAGDLNRQKGVLNGWGMKILPHAWPGFSWCNLKKLAPGTQVTPRAGGDFYWTRIKNAVNSGADQIFLGMFDEYDEGTSIMPMSDNHPAPHSAWGQYIDNEGKDPFYYLQLSGAASETLNGFRATSSGTPAESALTPAAYGGDDATVYLGSTNLNEGLVLKNNADGGTTATLTPLGGHEGRINGPDSSDLYFYFGIDDGLTLANASGQKATIEVEFFDNAAGATLRLQYDSLSAVYTSRPPVSLPASGGWKRIRWNVSDGFFGNRQNASSDFRIAVNSGKSVAVRRVSVFFPEEADGLPVDVLPTIHQSVGILQWPVGADVTGWRLHESPSLAPTSWEEVTDLQFSGGSVVHDLDTTNPASFYRLQRAARE